MSPSSMELPGRWMPSRGRAIGAVLRQAEELPHGGV